MVSIIIPTYNEERMITEALDHLRRARGNFEVIVVDGKSTDGTCSRVEASIPGFPRPLRLMTAERSPALQMNCGAGAAVGDALLFLHADAALPTMALEALEAELKKPQIVGGNFRLAFDGESWWNRFFTRVSRIRRSLGIYYGDSGIFVRREAFERLGGFQPIPVMEDYEFVRRMEGLGRTVSLEPVLRVSDRRWRVQGVFTTLSTWVWVQGLYSLGVSPEILTRWYKPIRDGTESKATRLPTHRDR